MSFFSRNFKHLYFLFRLLENRIGRLQDDLETSNLNANGGMAIMMSSSKTSNKKPKDPNKPVSVSNILHSLLNFTFEILENYFNCEYTTMFLGGKHEQKNCQSFQCGFSYLEGEQKKSLQPSFRLEAISQARVLQSIKISCLLLNFP